MDRGGTAEMLFANRADITNCPPAEGLPYLEADKPLVLLGGIHGGCYELFANERIRALRDLKGKRVAVSLNRIGRVLFHRQHDGLCRHGSSARTSNGS